MAKGKKLSKIYFSMLFGRLWGRLFVFPKHCTDSNTICQPSVRWSTQRQWSSNLENLMKKCFQTQKAMKNCQSHVFRFKESHFWSFVNCTLNFDQRLECKHPNAAQNEQQTINFQWIAKTRKCEKWVYWIYTSLIFIRQTAEL